MPTDPRELPKRDPSNPTEVVNPGDPGPNVLVPPDRRDPRIDPKLPPDVKKPAPAV